MLLYKMLVRHCSSGGISNEMAEIRSLMLLPSLIVHHHAQVLTLCSQYETLPFML